MTHCTRSGRLSREHGATMVEYLCVVALLNVALISAATSLGNHSSDSIRISAEAISSGGGSLSTIEGGDGTPSDPLIDPPSGILPD